MPYRIIGDQKARALEWATTRFPDTPYEPYWGEWCETLIHEHDGEILAVVIFNNLFPNNSVDMHVASAPGSRWLTRDFLGVTFCYPFLQLDLRRVNAKVGANNTAVIRFLTKLGFTHEGTHPEAWDAGVDLLSFGLLKKDCRFLGKSFHG